MRLFFRPCLIRAYLGVGNPLADTSILLLNAVHTHSYANGGGNHARHQPAHHFDSNSGGAQDPTGKPSGFQAAAQLPETLPPQ